MLRLVAFLGVTAFAVAIAGGLLDDLTWPGAALAVFRPWLVAGAAVSAAFALLVGANRVALAGLLAAVLGAALLVPGLRLERARPVPEGVPPLRLLTLNLDFRNDDVAAVTSLIRREQPDVIALSELTPAWADGLAPVLRSYRIRLAEPRPDPSGIGLFARRALTDLETVPLAGGASTAIEATATLPSGRVARLLLLHPLFPARPGRDRVHGRTLEEAGAWARDEGGRAVVCGDTNAPPWTQRLRSLAHRGALRLALGGLPFRGTWPDVSAAVVGFPLDGCLVGEDIQADARRLDGVGSDHVPVLVRLA